MTDVFLLMHPLGPNSLDRYRFDTLVVHPVAPSERSRGEEERGDESRSGFKAMPGESIRYCPFSTGDGSSFWAGDRPPGATGIRTGRDGRLPGGPVVYAASPTTCVTSFFRRSLFPTWHRRCWRSACISAVVRLERELRPSYRVRRPLPNPREIGKSRMLCVPWLAPSSASSSVLCDKDVLLLPPSHPGYLCFSRKKGGHR